MEENQLIEEIKNNNNNEAYSQLLEQFKKMIYAILNDYEFEFGDYQINKDDLFQEARIALYEAVLNYDETKNNKFSTFAYVVIKRRVNRFYNVSRKKYLYESYSIDDLEYGDHNSILKGTIVNDNSSTYTTNHKLQELLDKYKIIIKDEDRAILLLRIENYSYEEIAKKLNINKKRIDNRLCRLRKKYLHNKASME